VLHVLNGDSARLGIERSGIPGRFVVWPDILYEGPTPLATGEEWIAVRTAYLAGVADRPIGEVAERYRQNDAILESFRDHDEVVCWFEHDLFDQLLLIRHLWWLRTRSLAAEAQRAKAGAKVELTKLSLVCRDMYLGPLKPEAFPPLFTDRQPITDAQLDLGSRAWTAFCGDDPSRLLPFAVTVSPDLPFLAPALRRFLEEYPSAVNGLSRTESQILRVLSDRPLAIGDAFGASADLEDAIFMGDLSFFAIVEALASARHPLLTIDEDAKEPQRFVDRTIRLTDTGRRVLAGRADHVALNGIDRWLGGVRLTPERHWRWTGSSLLRATA
jgi:hypothetical protein